MTLPRSASAVLITGGAGFIGSALARTLVARGTRVVCVDDLSTGSAERLDPGIPLVRGDVAEPGVLEGLLGPLARSGERFTTVVHLAARVGVRRVLADPELCRAENRAGVQALIAALGDLDLPPDHRPRVFAASSSEVYEPSRAPLPETAGVRRLDATGRWAYAASKLGGEHALDASELWEPERAPVHLRFFNVVGPGQDADSGMVLPSFVEAAACAGSPGARPLVVHGDGSQVRTFAHVDEVAETLADLVLAPDVPAGPLNVGGVARASVLELAQTVTRVAGRGEIQFADPRRRLGARFEEIAWREPDCTRLAACGVRLPSMSLEASVRDTWERHTSLETAECASRAF